MAVTRLQDIPDGDFRISVAVGSTHGTGAQYDRAADHVRAYAKWLTGTVQDIGYVDYCYPNYTNSSVRMQNYRKATGFAVWSAYLIPQSYAGTVAAIIPTTGAGSLDSQYKALAQQFVDNGLGNAQLRLGWEGDQANFPGSAGLIGDANYGKVLRRAWQQMRQVTGFNMSCEVNFDVAFAVQQGLDPEKMWPGDDIADCVGLDKYDIGAFFAYKVDGVQYASTDHKSMWLKEQIGMSLSASYNFALKHDKPMVMTETGVMTNIDGHEGGDNVLWNDELSKFAKTHPRLKCVSLFNEIDGRDSRLAAYTSGSTDAVPVFQDNTATFPLAAPAARSTLDGDNNTTGWGSLARFNGRTGNTAQKALLDMIANYKSLTAGAATVLATLQSTQAALTAANAQVASLQTTNTALSNQHTADTNTINTQAATIASQAAQITSLQNQGSNPATAAKLAWAEAQVQALLPYAIGTKKDLAQLQAEEAALQATIDPLVAQLVPLQAADLSLDQQIINLQNLINSPEP